MTDNIENIESRVAKAKAMAVTIGTVLGNVKIDTVNDLDVMADRLSRGEVAVPPHCRGKMGVCHAIILQALEWRMPIMSVINKSYVVNNRGTERIAYESQLIHAIIERNAPLKGRLRYEILGEGDDRRCMVWATFERETEPHKYTSQTLGALRDARGRNEQGVLKGSPLWDKDPEVQLFYSASRQWARLFCPDVILGAYTPEDPQWSDASSHAVDVTPSSRAEEYANKLREAKAARAGDRGFDADYVHSMASERGTSIIEGEVNPDPAKQEVKDDSTQGRRNEPNDQRRQDGPASSGNDNRDASGSGSNVGTLHPVRSQLAGKEVADSDQAEIFPPDRKPVEKPKPKSKR
jgi:RecT family protein